MCQFASFLHNPLTGEVAVSDLSSHGNTEKELKLDPKVWCEGHYLPGGEIRLRLPDDTRVEKLEYEERFRERFPAFVSFFAWAMKQTGKDKLWPGDLNLNGLTSAKGLTLPQSIGGWLSLDGLTTAEGLTLPQSIGGGLYLDGLTSAEKEGVFAELEKRKEHDKTKT